MTDGHDHAHDTIEHAEGPPGEYQLLATAVRDLLIEKGVFSADDMRRTVEEMEMRSPAAGARVVARAWVDPDYKARLLANGRSAAEELGVDLTILPHLLVVENTDEVHNMVVCTLCSCYPRGLLGIPPAWYKSFEYRSRAVKEPRAVLAEFGTDLPGHVEVRVHDSTADMRYLVLPARPAGTEDLSEEQLAEIVTRDCMIGVARPVIG